MLPVLQVGPLSIRMPGLVLLAALWLALEVAARAGVRRGLNPDRLYNFGFLVVVAGIAGARLAFVLAHLNLYTRITPVTRALGAALSLSPGTEIAWAGVLIAAAAAVLLARLWRLPPLPLADAFAPALAVLTLGVGLAALLRGDLLGMPADLPWAIDLAGARRHPTQAYIMLVAAAALIVAWRLERTPPERRAPGTLAQIVVMVLCVGVLLVEPLRADSATIGPGLRVMAVVALAVLVADLALFAARAPVRVEEDMA